jgi:hypothetical protein
MNTLKSAHDKMPGDGSEHTEETKKTLALAKYLDEDIDSISESSHDDCLFEVGSREYLVLTDDEADERAADYIKDSLWAFNSSFLASYCDMPEEMFKAVQDKCESSNDAVLQCVERADGGLKGFIEEAVAADGRGHFMSSYDGEENEEGDYFIYRTN